MNRLAFGAGVLALAPLFSGCSNFYLVTPPPAEPTATPAPTAIPYPFDPTAGSAMTDANSIAQNGKPGLPTAFRVAELQDIKFGIGRANDPANATLLMVLQPLNEVAAVPAGSATKPAGSAAPGAAAPGGAGVPDGAPAAGSTAIIVPGSKDNNNPYRLAGIIVPGPAGRVGAGLQDADEQALQAEASRRMIETVSRWMRVTGTFAPTPVPGATVAPNATPTSLPRARAIVSGTPAPVPSIVDPSQKLNVYQDKQFPVDSENRRLVQIMFKSTGGPGITAGTELSLNRMLVRSGWAVVDLYSPTSFDQKTWLLDEAYARHRSLGIWGLELNGKKLALQQRIPAPSTGTGALSRVPVTNGVTPPTGVPIRPGVSATQSPATVTPTIVPSIPRVVTKSGTSISRGPSGSAVLPPPSAATAPAGGAPAGQPGGGGLSPLGNSAVPQ
ncbi:hypothetical protein EON83_26000 [bacterium]|nr:MAG: hypothetical protein EON83_26000 [bacterium]